MYFSVYFERDCALCMCIVRAFIFGWLSMWIAALLVYSDSGSGRGRVDSRNQELDTEKTVGIEAIKSTL